MSVEVTDAEGIRRVLLRNDRKLNTLNTPILLDLAVAFGVGDETRAVLLTGEGERAFIGGADINEMAAIASPQAARDFIGRIHAVCAAIRACPVPVIARIQGWCLGAGLEVAAACDLRLAGEAARFGMPEVRVGLPSVVEAALLPGLIGWGRTRRLLLLGETIGAQEALGWGLIERIVPQAELDAAVEEWLEMLRAAGPHAIRAQKALIAEWEERTPRLGIEAGVAAFGRAFETDEPARMLGTFARRRR